MRTRTSRLLCWLMSVLLCAQLVPTQALAYAAPQVVEGTYSFTTATAIDNSIHVADTFTFREDCFMRSSFLGCTHLSELSAQLAMSSFGWFGEAGDPYEDNIGDTGHNMKNLLSAMGFSNVQTNGYCQSDTLADSVGVAVGRRTISVGDNTYTLLAVPIRSSGYKREWVGNFTVGNGELAVGFKDARDEVLRFVKHYITQYSITGNVKLWVVGHSRGAAVANMVGGFFADGGSAYLGDNVSIAPEDVYCYCYAPPATIKAGASKADELSVSAARNGAYQDKDTPGKEFVSSATGTLEDPQDAAVFGGIRSYINQDDVVTMLPPASWGFTRYGTMCPLDGGVASKDQMANELAGISDVIYSRLVNGGDSDQYAPVLLDVLNLDVNNLDLNALPFVSADGTGENSMSEFMSERVAGLAKAAQTNASYAADGYEDALRAAAGTLFLVNDKITDGGLAGILKADTDKSLVKSLAFGYLAYAADQLINSGVATNEAEAATIVLSDLLSYVNGSQVQATTVDELLACLGQFVATNENTPFVQSLLDAIVAALPDNDFLLQLLIAIPSYYGHDDIDQVETQSDMVVDDPLVLVNSNQNDSELTDEQIQQLAEALGTTLNNLVNKQDVVDIDVVTQNDGAEDNTSNETRQQARQALLTWFKDMGSDTYGLAARTTLLELLPALTTFVGIDFGSPTADTKISDLLVTLLPSFMKKNDEETYASFAEASDGFFTAGINAVTPALVEGARTAYGDSYAEELGGYLATLAGSPTQARNILVGMLFGTKGYDTTYALATISTFVRSTGAVVVGHTCETYLAWMRAVRKATNEGPHAIYQPITVLANPQAGGTTSANTSEVLPGTKVTLVATVNTGYTFAGWTAVAPEGLTIQNDSFIMPDSAVEVRGDFEPIAYSVAFSANGGSGSMAKQSFVYDAQQALSANAFTRKGYSFVGWNTKKDGSGKAYKNKQEVVNLTSKDGGVVTLYAQWKKVPTYTVAFKANGGKGSMQKQSFAHGTKKALSANAFTRKGYTFVGWNTKKDGSGKAYKNKQQVVNLTSKDGGVVTLYAQWKKNAASIPSVKVVAHSQNLGWCDAISMGSVYGTTQKSLRLEAVRISIPNSRYSGGVEYRSHVQNVGWEKTWNRDGKTSGTTGKGLRLEGIQIRLYGAMRQHYDVWYRVHAQNIGWMAWAKNGQKAGTQGLGCRAEALQVVLVKKGDKAPSKIYKGAIQSTTRVFANGKRG